VCSAPFGRSRLAFLTFFYLLSDGKKSKKLSPIIALAFFTPIGLFLMWFILFAPICFSCRDRAITAQKNGRCMRRYYFIKFLVNLSE
jgi:hypothetical protein